VRQKKEKKGGKKILEGNAAAATIPKQRQRFILFEENGG